MTLREEMYVDQIDRQFPFFLAGDIGGTNSNFGIFSMNPLNPQLVLSLHYKSQHVSDFTAFMQQVVDYVKSHYDITFAGGCLGAAGVVYPHRISARPTNLSFEINIHQITRVTHIPDLFLINDFEAVALGIELLPPSDILSINQEAVYHKHANSAFIGAGTGLGKSMVLWDRNEHRYMPVASEGGHADAVFYTQQELALSTFIHDEYVKCPVSWEMLLSGAGIQRIYRFLGTLNTYPETEYSQEIAASDFPPDKISYYAQRDQRCKDTFDMYRKYYARACKNFVLESLALNGIYIAGGIAAKNRQLFFDPLFMQEFTSCGKQHLQLLKVPVSLITNYNVSLYGAYVAARIRKKGTL